jgi:hypothetical protein
MKYFCPKGHVHDTQKQADNCYICKRRARRREGRRSATLLLDEEKQQSYLLKGERQHINSTDCWCKPYQDELNPNVWVHNKMPTGSA